VSARIRGPQNDYRRIFALPTGHLAGNHCAYSGNYHLAFHVENEEQRCCRTPKIKYCLCCSESFNCYRAPMKTVLSFAAIVGLAIGVFADIQDPPGNDFGPTRKLGRGISNFIIAPTEFFTTVNQINQTEGNSAGAGYGVWKGAGRTAARHVAGLIEILT